MIVLMKCLWYFFHQVSLETCFLVDNLKSGKETLLSFLVFDDNKRPIITSREGKCCIGKQQVLVAFLKKIGEPG